MSGPLNSLKSWLSERSVQTGLLILLPLLHLGYRDYTAWYQLGPSGLPRNVVGWLLQTVVRIIASSDVKSLKYYDTYMEGIEAQSFIGIDVPEHKGARPKVGAWAVPHRQLEATANPEMKMVRLVSPSVWSAADMLSISA